MVNLSDYLREVDVTIREQLWEIAADQYGYVTSHDAVALGIGKTELGKLAHRGKLDRVFYGVYRVPEIPQQALDQYMLAVLWTGGRGVLSHETVLALRELCDVNPSKIHLTVPPRYYPRGAEGDLYAVHRQRLGTDDTEFLQGIPAVKVSIAIAQAVSQMPYRLVDQAITQARSEGLISTSEAGDLYEHAGRS